jgi:hypothetical protein
VQDHESPKLSPRQVTKATRYFLLAAAGGSISCSQIIGSNYGFASTVTPAQPLSAIMTITLRLTDHCKHPEPLAGQINQATQ